MSQRLNMPSARVPVLDSRGLLTREWLLWFQALQDRGGGVEAASNNELAGDIADAASRDEMLARIGAVEAQSRGVQNDATVESLSQRVAALEALVRDGIQAIQQMQMLMLGGDFPQAPQHTNPVGDLDTLHVRGQTRLATQSGNVLVGSLPDDATNKLQVDGSVVATLYRVGLDQVVGARQAGVTAVPAYGGQTIDATYNQAQVQAIDSGLRDVRASLASIDAALRLHGLYDN